MPTAELLVADAHPLTKRRGRGSRAIAVGAPMDDRELANKALAGINRFRAANTQTSQAILYRSPAVCEPVPIATHGAKRILVIAATKHSEREMSFSVIAGLQPALSEGWKPKDSEVFIFTALDDAIEHFNKLGAELDANGWDVDYRDSGTQAPIWDREPLTATRDKLAQMVSVIARCGGLDLP